VSAGPKAAATTTIEEHRRAVRANPRNAKAHALLGLALQRLNQLEQAVASQRRALQLDPGLTGLYGSMAPALHAMKQNEAAVDAYRRAVAIQGQDADLHKGLSDVLRDLRQFEAAAASARQAVALRPDDAAMHLTLAAAQFAMADYEAAGASFRRVLEIVPDHVDVRFDLGHTLFRLRRHDEAVTCYQQVLALQPDHFDAHCHLGACQRELKQFDAAVATFQRALEIRPDNWLALYETGASLQQLGKLELARANFERALQISPDEPQILGALAHACFELGHLQQALQHARRRLELEPGSATAHSAMLFVLSHFTSDAAELTSAHRGFGERWEAAYLGRYAPHANQRDPARKLRVGFVSADLYHHAVARFILPIFQILKESTATTLYVYYNNNVEDDLTAKMRGDIAHWHSINELDDDAAEQQIRRDGIDILIDLSGHSARNRLPLFARKPAPVQASWIGYAGTTGLQAVDYYVSDQFHLPEGRYDDQFTEQIVRMPLGAPFSPEPNAPPVNPLPALSNGYLTFGSFHRASKLSREVIAHWSLLLRAMPESRMLLGGLRDGDDTTLLDWFEAEGIARARLLLRPRTTVHGYLAQHHEVDICLSPFPYTGSTTICHALWMGVPTLTTVGPTNPSHSSVTYLAHLGLGSFLAEDDASFVQLGKFLSENLPTLAALRASMRDRFNASVVGYPGVAAVGFEHAVRLMWQRWCAGLPPAPLKIRMADLVEAEAEGGT
jgi:protein O-GlcNAc transferase